VRSKSSNILSAEELEDLAQLAGDWRGLLDRSRSFTARLRRARRERELVESRLLCVLHDFLAPAVQDLEAIAAAAGAPKEGDPQ
jgi:hypothetical protein